ncbi:hypothetical protein QRX50_17690 [Amycolatopsis carbonis]|uniref:ABC transmembrane type-1 domain-containing protein n=1 Tax=Amycolatopsis carbonis TaxID=715471 RepID=A0A9Y2MZC1_9PSEU|nr:hypothetical protein [Amycolatopsis sp. 2-15]WIX82463.1 hypothetical protein QRX50_17690 [Amycolatopsis sp. 2-15]
MQLEAGAAAFVQDLAGCLAGRRVVAFALGPGERAQRAARERNGADSIFVSVTITVGRVVFNSMAGYALARLRFRGRSAVFGAVVAVLAVPSVVLLIPKFLVLNQFGMYDTYAAMIIPLLADASGVFIMKQFFESVP